MEVLIRKALQHDCAAMMGLIKELAIYEKEPHAVTVTLAHFEESGFGEKPVWEAFVAEVDGAVIGFALWYVRYSTWKGQRMYLEDFIVTEQMRGQQIGKQLFDALLAEARKRQYSGVVWQVLDWNTPAINFYKKYDGVQFDAGWLNAAINL
ncbi:GNAT family N-acetyltransferase [Ferruginibacter yonginensis]|uniref:GNAT family N-acetyltransferase n=1 Tax=Ferruginibacter yonginensis TaxID=1310416 RepID=A0ABV8QWU7_9BACT